MTRKFEADEEEKIDKEKKEEEKYLKGLEMESRAEEREEKLVAIMELFAKHIIDHAKAKK